MRRMITELIKAILIVTISAGFSSCKKENPAPQEEPVSLLVTPAQVEFEAEGGTSDIQITSNSSWMIINNSDWCTSSVDSAAGDTSVTLTALPNEEETERTTTLLIMAEDTTREVMVTQKGYVKPILEVTYDIPPDNTDMRDLTSVELAAEMGVGWNLGNSLEAIPSETSWGNPLVTHALIDSVHAAGFNSIRIPVAWSKFSDEENFTIETEWLDRVEEVVNYVLDNDMYAIVNIHWDGGWMQPTYEEQEYVNNRLAIMWDQIAKRFRDYDDHLLFAGTNEVMVEGNYGTPSPENRIVQNSFNQTFVEAVRSTGGRNAYRHLVVQGYNTNINFTVSYNEIPLDVMENRLMMEVHYYDPYNYTLNESSNIWQWGSIATNPENTETWANESYVDDQFEKMKTNFVDEGYAVILGEYGAIARTDIAGSEVYREYYMEYITQSAVDHGMVPFYWDNGGTGNHGFGLFNRSTGGQAYPGIIDAIISALD